MLWIEPMSNQTALARPTGSQTNVPPDSVVSRSVIADHMGGVFFVIPLSFGGGGLSGFHLRRNCIFTFLCVYTLINLYLSKSFIGLGFDADRHIFEIYLRYKRCICPPTSVGEMIEELQEQEGDQKAVSSKRCISQARKSMPALALGLLL